MTFINLIFIFLTIFLNESLRCLGNVLIDRYKSLQRRNIIEPRIRHRTLYRYKHKVFKKRSHVEPTGYKVMRKQDKEKDIIE